jgi:hypothetical protein
MTIRPLTIILILIAMILIMIVAIPSWRLSIRDRLIPDTRTLIAKIDGKISADGPALIVLKIKTRDQYFLEVYKANQNLDLIQRIALEEPLDGKFLFQGQYTNLAFADLDNDGSFEVVAPMYDKNSVPRLLIFKFNSSLQSFEKLTSE